MRSHCWSRSVEQLIVCASQAPPNMAQWWKLSQPRVLEEQAEEPRIDRRDDLTTLGMLRAIGHPYFEYYEMRHLQFVNACLTRDWPSLQAGTSPEALVQWHFVFEWLELDRKAVMDMLLLCHSGLVGRSEANRVLWELLSIWALKEEYVDISRKTSTLVWEARRHFERPPQADRDCNWWEPRHYVAPRLPQWSPLAVRWDPVTLEYLPTYPDINGDPQPPPGCWAPPAGGLWV